MNTATSFDRFRLVEYAKIAVMNTNDNEKREIIKKVSEGRFMVAAASSDGRDCTAACASGDAAGACSLPGGRLAFILSDGMGKGMKAAAESQAVVRRLRRLLKKGVSPSRAIKLVNKQLIKRSEIFATIDLTIIDKNTGFAKVYKLGATTSFLLRAGRVDRIESAGLPVGMINKIQTRQLKMKLRPGDTIVMVSDGITEADRTDLEANWLLEYLAGTTEEVGPRILAGDIAKAAQEKYGIRERDDITAIVIQIK